MQKTIGLLDHLGHGNLGDDATLDAVMHNIRSRWPNAKLIGLSLNPYDTEQRHGIPSYAIRRDSKNPPSRDVPESSTASASLKQWLKSLLSRCLPILLVLRTIKNVVVRTPTALFQEFLFLVECFRIVRSLDVLVVCGGGQLLDRGGPWRFPYTLFKWTFLAKLSGATRQYLNVGAGPLGGSLSRWFIKFALHLSNYVSFRDESSRTLLQDIGFRRPADVFPDNVYSLEIPVFNASESRHSHRPVVGLSPIAYRDARVCFWDKDQAAYDRYIRQITSFASCLARDRHQIRLFSTEISFDSLAIEDVQSALKKDTGIPEPYSIKHDEIQDATTLFSQMALMDYIVTSRFHGVVFAHLMNKPVLAISPHPKVATLMNDAGLSAYCVDIRTFDLDLLISTFNRLVQNQDDIKRQMAEIVASRKARLLRQFDNLFGVARIEDQGAETAVPHPNCWQPASLWRRPR
jgi:polysaccharide pyruvyl transferase WcaK-like protein